MELVYLSSFVYNKSVLCTWFIMFINEIFGNMCRTVVI
jgi:hypothetical protein